MKKRFFMGFVLATLVIVGGVGSEQARAADKKPNPVEPEKVSLASSAEKSGKDEAARNAETQRKVQEALAKKSPDEIRTFTEKIEKEKAAFQEKYLSMAIGEREKMARDFADKVRAARQGLEKELQAFTPDPKEKVLRDYQEKVKTDRAELADKLKLMKIGPKEEKMTAFDKDYEGQRKALMEKMDKMPLDQREQMYKVFKADQDKKIKQFYGL